jgi:hypothetical protein
LIRLTQGSLFLNVGVLSLFIGVGLLRYSRGWRTCALVFLWLAMIGFPLAAVFMLFTDQPLQFTVFDQPMGEVPRGVGVGVAALGFALAVWQYWVLTRPRVRRLFGVPADPASVFGVKQPPPLSGPTPGRAGCPHWRLGGVRRSRGRPGCAGQ